MGFAPNPSRALPCTCQRVFDPLDSLFAIELVTLSHNVRVSMRGFASADATKGQWKQTKSAIALWTASSPPALVGW